MKKKQLKDYIAKLEAYKDGELTDYISELEEQVSLLGENATESLDTEPPNPPPTPPHFP